MDKLHGRPIAILEGFDVAAGWHDQSSMRHIGSIAGTLVRSVVFEEFIGAIGGRRRLWCIEMRAFGHDGPEVVFSNQFLG